MRLENDAHCDKMVINDGFETLRSSVGDEKSFGISSCESKVLKLECRGCPINCHR